MLGVRTQAHCALLWTTATGRFIVVAAPFPLLRPDSLTADGDRALCAGSQTGSGRRPHPASGSGLDRRTGMCRVPSSRLVRSTRRGRRWKHRGTGQRRRMVHQRPGP